ncbi:MAG: multicopper oxidase family protein [Thermoanaerobaculia bacterium]
MPVETPDLPRMPWRMENGVKVFHIVAEPVRLEFLPGRPVDAWGFNGSVPGPTIEVNQGDRVRFVVENRLPEVTSMHWHGFEVPIGMDGGPGISQDPIPPGGKFVYEFTLHQHGTFFYHSHMPMQEMMGMIGLFIMHPREPYRPRVDRDFGLIFQEWAILPNNTVPNTLSMEFNWLTINGKAGPATTPMLVKLGERVRVRMVNLGMDHHPIHLHGNTFYTTATEGGRIPKSAWEPGNTVLLGVAQARDFEFDAIYPGDWMLHCHLPHHMMNQMVSMVGPLAHVGTGMHTGLGMEEGMGMLREGHALSENNGPSLGRSIGLGAQFEKPVTNIPLGGGHSATQHSVYGGRDLAPVAPNARQVPGYPQDMFMVMDDMVAKPETWGLRPTWTAGMMGMMTLVRVLKPEVYDHIQKLKAERKSEARS